MTIWYTGPHPKGAAAHFTFTNLYVDKAYGWGPASRVGYCVDTQGPEAGPGLRRHRRAAAAVAARRGRRTPPTRRVSPLETAAPHRYARAMRVLTSDPPPAEMEALLERRRRIGLDRYDEMWNGVLHMNPGPSGAHQDIVAQLTVLFSTLAREVDLFVRPGVNIGESNDFRSPDVVIQRERLSGVWHETAALAVEIRSPNDDAWKKLGHYAEHQVDELIVVEPRAHSVQWLRLTDGEYLPTDRSDVIPLGPQELAAQLDWPPLED